MPCSKCGKDGHNARSCTEENKTPKARVIRNPKSTPDNCEPCSVVVKVRRKNADDVDLDGLEERLRAKLEAIGVEVEEVEARFRKLVDERARLLRVLEALAAGKAQPAAAVG